MKELPAQPICSASITINDGSQLFEKIFRNDKVYEEAIEASAKFNKQLVSERKMRIPFIDSQTRVAQTNSLLWYMEYQRARGAKIGQLVSYPVKKWYKNRRRFLDTDSNILPHRMATPVDSTREQFNENSNSMDAFNHQQHAFLKQNSNTEDHDHHQQHNHKASATSNAASANVASVIDDWHMHEDSFDNFDEKDDESEGEDYEESRKKKGKKVSLNTLRDRTRQEDSNKISFHVFLFISQSSRLKRSHRLLLQLPPLNKAMTTSPLFAIVIWFLSICF